MKNLHLSAIGAKKRSRARKGIAMNVGRGHIVINVNSNVSLVILQKARMTWKLIDKSLNIKNATSNEARQWFEAWQMENIEARYFETSSEEGFRGPMAEMAVRMLFRIFVWRCGCHQIYQSEFAL